MMLQIDQLPHLNAVLNSISALLLLCGFAAIRSGKPTIHKGFMMTAAVSSALFLSSYLVYHFNAPIFKFNGDGGVRIFYYALLISHVLLAVINLPMIIGTFAFALKGNFDRHRPLARWTFGVWLYVSVTGILVYLMLYQFNPAATA